jgi:hypothetical protein
VSAEIAAEGWGGPKYEFDSRGNKTLDLGFGAVRSRGRQESGALTWEKMRKVFPPSPPHPTLLNPRVIFPPPPFLIRVYYPPPDTLNPGIPSASFPSALQTITPNLKNCSPMSV